jgi:hypothetical protein
MPRGKTLWEMLVEAFSSPVEMRYYNPLKAKIGSFLTLEDLDLRDLDFRVKEIRQYRRHLGERDYLFVDYVVLARPVGGKEVLGRLRLNPVENPDPAAGKTHDALFLKLYDETPYSYELHQVVRDSTGLFQVIEDGKVTAEFHRLNNLRTAYRATVTIIEDLNQDGKVQSGEVRTHEVDYWDYWRDTTDEAGRPAKEFLFVELDKETNGFQIWRGRPIDLLRAFVV